MDKQKGIGTVVAVIVIAVIAIAGALVIVNTRRPTAPPRERGTPATSSSETRSSAASTSPNDTSDAALTQDETSVNTKLNALESDSANIDSGLNDRQGDLSE